MKCRVRGSFPRIREYFHNSDELGQVINRGTRTIMTRLKVGGWTDKEQRLILAHMGLEDTQDNRREVFTL